MVCCNRAYEIFRINSCEKWNVKIKYILKFEIELKFSHQLTDNNIRVYKTGKTINNYCSYLLLTPVSLSPYFEMVIQKPLLLAAFAF